MVVFQRSSTPATAPAPVSAGSSLRTRRSNSHSHSHNGPRRHSRATLTRILMVMLVGVLTTYTMLVFSVAFESRSNDSNESNTNNDKPGKIDIPVRKVPIASAGAKTGVRADSTHRANDGGDDNGGNGNINGKGNDSNNEVHKGHQSTKTKTDSVLRVYLEQVNQREWDTKPLPIRTNAVADKLKVIEYPTLTSCSRLLEQFPVDDQLRNDDLFLPWIHDIFPDHNGTFIQFVAQNKRRCNTGKNHDKILKKRQPQEALFQDLAVKRITIDNDNDNNNETRYRLSTHEDADPDGVSTRFICRFQPSGEETLSTYNANYEFITFRKGGKSTFSKDGHSVKSLTTSQLIFQCPVPPSLQQTVKDGSSVLNDYATLFVDLIPIRTPPRYNRPEAFFPPRYKEHQQKSNYFDPNVEWGNKHILPKIIDSGRWENLPICKPSILQYEPEAIDKRAAVTLKDDTKEHVKKHRLVACVWASAQYATRGERFAIDDGQRRLKEWLTFNFITGFDHIYVYDNTGAFTNETSLQPVTDLFPDQVTRIPWHATICNNNKNNVDSPGERSSQYAAESSCRLRFGPHTEWLGGFDIDEYLVPLTNYTKVPQLLDKLDREGTKIINFGSWRAWPRKNFIEEPEPITGARTCGTTKSCFVVKVPQENTMLQAYNCDRQRGQKTKVMPAEKQIYRPDYVKLHFVHFTTMTALSAMSRSETVAAGGKFSARISSDPAARYSDEETEGTMLHTKAMATQDTSNWQDCCKGDDRKACTCRIGNPYPEGAYGGNTTHDKEGWRYNCYINEKIDNYWIPLLEMQLKAVGN